MLEISIIEPNLIPSFQSKVTVDLIFSEDDGRYAAAGLEDGELELGLHF